MADDVPNTPFTDNSEDIQSDSSRDNAGVQKKVSFLENTIIKQTDLESVKEQYANLINSADDFIKSCITFSKEHINYTTANQQFNGAIWSNNSIFCINFDNAIKRFEYNPFQALLESPDITTFERRLNRLDRFLLELIHTIPEKGFDSLNGFDAKFSKEVIKAAESYSKERYNIDLNTSIEASTPGRRP